MDDISHTREMEHFITRYDHWLIIMKIILGGHDEDA